ncbi:CDP-alcohol phosphatidyltransferase family protein [Brachybacterium muris]|uniref:CDP-alcohol phosphatidyltransferase family protein n=1 Tax=Brachybacterium muris TaxID=219301 RepID=UPI00223BE294|nr:CDP-alcohol phosphatidyltransferase family protein [Brachybacterium muris]MCT2260385.1 CDP-alcohol phosphatidyltransferase family protein [Brachybacterium muris]
MLRPRRALRLPALHLPAPRLPAGGEAILQGLHLSVAPGVAAGQCAADGLGPARAVVAAGLALGGSVLTDVLLGPEPLTPADHVTRFRSSLVAAQAGRLVAGGLAGGGHPTRGAPDEGRRTVAQAAVFTLAIGLDAVDGQVARRTGSSTQRGWRFDLEADAAAIAVLAATMVHRTGWVLVPGSLRYVFGGLRQVAPALRGGLQPRLSRRVAAGASMVALVITTWPQVPGRAVHVLSAGATMALLASFGRDSVDLLRGASR